MSTLDLDAVRFEASLERWPLREAFRIARGAKTEAVVLVVTASVGAAVGRGEAVPYARYGETPDATLALARSTVARDVDRLAPGAVRSALADALLDLEAVITGVPVHTRLGLPAPAPVEIAATLSVDRPEVMASRAPTAGALLKLKLAGDGLDRARIEAVHGAAPAARLWLDANEGLDVRTLEALLPTLATNGVVLVEQPLPEHDDAALARIESPIPLCADESAHDAATIAALADRYDAVNVKVQKAGGLRGALAAIDAAQRAGLDVVLGCMVSTSLAIAPAQLLAPRASFVDLDGALFLASDRDGGGRLEGGRLVPATLWGRG